MSKIFSAYFSTNEVSKMLADKRTDIIDMYTESYLVDGKAITSSGSSLTYLPTPSTATIGMSPAKAKVQNVPLSESEKSTPK